MCTIVAADIRLKRKNPCRAELIVKLNLSFGIKLPYIFWHLKVEVESLTTQ